MSHIDFSHHTAVPRGLRPKLKTSLSALCDELGHPDKSISVLFIDDQEMQALKLEHWGEDQTTDVLSFPTFEPGDPFIPPHLGDIVISLETAAKQALEQGHSLLEEVKILCAHSLWHLLGNDHNTEKEWKGFRSTQARILEL